MVGLGPLVTTGQLVLAPVLLGSCKERLAQIWWS